MASPPFRVPKPLFRLPTYSMCDCGQMSAWYLFSAMGFYPVSPGDNRYVLGSPAFPLVRMHMSNGKTLTVKPEHFSKASVYVQKVTLNGKPWDKVWISHGAVAAGGELVFTLGPKPNTRWATGPDATLGAMHLAPIEPAPRFGDPRPPFSDASVKGQPWPSEPCPSSWSSCSWAWPMPWGRCPARSPRTR